jgi:hypothetical protein
MIKPIGAACGALLLIFLQACDKAAPPPGASGASGSSAVASAPPTGQVPGTPRPGASKPIPDEPAFSDAERNPERLLRMNRRSVSTLLGKPQFVRREATARVWQYRAGACVLDLFLYDSESDYEVVHYEFRSAAKLFEEPPGCFEELLTRAAKTADS